jgi:hypothetical protein
MEKKMENDFYEPDPREALALRKLEPPFVLATKNFGNPSIMLVGEGSKAWLYRTLLDPNKPEYHPEYYTDFADLTIDPSLWYKKLDEDEFLFLLILNDRNAIFESVRNDLIIGKDFKYL